MEKIPLNTGDVFRLDLNGKVPSGTYAMKYPHCFIVVTNNALISRYNHPLVNCVPMESLRLEKHWDNDRGCLKYFFHYELSKSKYSVLKRDSVVMCEHLYTLDRKNCTDQIFTVDKVDLDNIKQKISRVIGFSGH